MNQAAGRTRICVESLGRPISARIEARLSFRSVTFGVSLLLSLVVVSVRPPTARAATRALPRLAVAWDDSSAGIVRAMQTDAPFAWVTEPLVVGRNAKLRAKGRRLYAISETSRTLHVIDTDSWTIKKSFDLSAHGGPRDLAVVGRRWAYSTLAREASLLKLDLRTGETGRVIDLGVFVEKDVIPDPLCLTAHEGRLFIQFRELGYRRAPQRRPQTTLAVLDLASDQLLDVDPVAEGIQGVALFGTYPKFKAQVLPQRRQLVLSATGAFFDLGGIEAVDLDSLQSLGLLIREEDDQTGANLGAFVMFGARRGYLVFSTDLLLSSHLHAFRAFQGTAVPELQTSLNYFVPALARSTRTRTFFSPEGGSQHDKGVHAYDIRSGTRLTRAVTPTAGPPSDLELIRGQKLRRTSGRPLR